MPVVSVFIADTLNDSVFDKWLRLNDEELFRDVDTLKYIKIYVNHFMVVNKFIHVTHR